MRIKAEVRVPEETEVFWTMCSLGKGCVLVNRDDTRELLGSSFGVVGLLNDTDAKTVSEWVGDGLPVSVPKFRRIDDDFGNETIVALITTDSEADNGKTKDVEFFDSPFEDYE